MARYSNIRRGGELKYAMDNWINYMSDYENRESNIGQGVERGPQKTVFVTPFGEDVDENEIILASVTETHLAVLQTHIDAEASSAVYVPTDNGVVDGKTLNSIAGFRPAKIVWFRNQNKVKTVATSKVTKLRYLKYAGDRYSCPFGKATANDDQQDSFLALKTRLKSQSFAVNRVSLVREKYAS